MVLLYGTCVFACLIISQSCPTLVTQLTVTFQDPPSMGFSRQEYFGGLPYPSPGDLPDPGIRPRSPAFRQTLYQLSYKGRPLCSAGNYIQYPVINHSEKDYEKECLFVKLNQLAV